MMSAMMMTLLVGVTRWLVAAIVGTLPSPLLSVDRYLPQHLYSPPAEKVLHDWLHY
jgi:hypothetical protein